VETLSRGRAEDFLALDEMELDAARLSLFQRRDFLRDGFG
jgi:hypothetical protein